MMATVSIIGAGEVGAATAAALAALDRVGRILLIDSDVKAATGKALDIQQSGAIAQFHTRVRATDDVTGVAGTNVCVIADRMAQPPIEWTGDEGLSLIVRLAPYLDDVPLVFAGTSQSGLLSSAAHEGHIARRLLIASAPEALVAAIKAIVAVEAHCSPSEIQLAVLGAPNRFVIPWSDASIAGYPLERVLTQVEVARVVARAERLWPPGPFALGAAAARVATAIVESSRQSFSVMTMLGGEFGIRGRVGVLPSVLSSLGIAHTRQPSLNTRERVQLETALGV